jgi:hypothetical protein
MPHDRATQESLGLFHGYPTWWKKLALEQQRPQAIDDRPVALGTGRPNLPGLTASTSLGSLGSGMSNAVVSSNWRAGPGPMGGAGIPRAPSSPTPLGGSSVGRGGSIGFGSGGRGSARQPRTFGEYLTSSPTRPLSQTALGETSSVTSSTGNSHR